MVGEEGSSPEAVVTGEQLGGKQEKCFRRPFCGIRWRRCRSKKSRRAGLIGSYREV